MRTRRRAVTTASRVLIVVVALALPGAAARAVCPCTGDVDGSGAIGFEDLLAVLASWGPCEGCPADVDESGVVDFADLLVVLGAWGPCVFDYGPTRASAEAEQIGLELLGPEGPLVVPDAVYARIARDLELIRAAYPGLADQAHAPAWLPDHLVVKKVPEAPSDEYDALNACFQLVREEHLFGDWYVLVFPGALNVPALAVLYAALDAIEFAEPDGLIGGENFWRPAVVGLAAADGATWRWDIDDGWHDCFDGCDCHRHYILDVASDGAIEELLIEEYGQEWCEFGP